MKGGGGAWGSARDREKMRKAIQGRGGKRNEERVGVTAPGDLQDMGGLG